MPGLNPYSHSCTEHSRLLCPACEWARQQLRPRNGTRPAEKDATDVVKNQGPMIPTRDAVVIFVQVAALYLAAFVLCRGFSGYW